MNVRRLNIVFSLLFVSLVGVNSMFAQSAPPLGTSLPQFGVLGGAGVTGSTGAGTSVNGDVGSSPTATITNFVGSTIPGPSRTVPPFIVHYTNDAVVQQAHLDAIAAYTNLLNQGPGTVLDAQLSGDVLTAGLYSFASEADLASGGTLTLNGPGIFIFNVNSSLTANTLSQVVGTANPCNIYWRVGSSATLNGANFFGNVIADQSVTVSSSTNLIGRAVAINGAVTMPGGGGNTIGGCSGGGTGGPGPGPGPGGQAAGGSTLDTIGLTVLLGLLTMVGVFAVNRFSS
jgi:hypothetical protein